MIVNTAVFTCSICGEPSTEICAYCTKDACANHRCIRCNRCSDCCECEIPLSAEEVSEEPAAEAAETPVDQTAVAPMAGESQAFAEPEPPTPEESQAHTEPEPPTDSTGHTIANDSADSGPAE